MVLRVHSYLRQHGPRVAELKEFYRRERRACMRPRETKLLNTAHVDLTLELGSWICSATSALNLFRGLESNFEVEVPIDPLVVVGLKIEFHCRPESEFWSYLNGEQRLHRCQIKQANAIHLEIGGYFKAIGTILLQITEDT